MTALPAEVIRHLVGTALAEDLGAGDITVAAAIPAAERAVAEIMARESCVVAGLPLVAAVFAELDREIEVRVLLSDGARVPAGATVCRVTGPGGAILSGERTALNFIQRLSGIATLTRRFVDAVSGTGAQILDTRKTTPTLRLLEKYAVARGGGVNHRMGLYDAMMIKDNHRVILDRRGSQALGDAVRALRRDHPGVQVVIEADALEDVEQALAVGADQVLLDNMSLGELREAVALVGGRAKTEASGGITLDNAADIAATGVDYLSVGALTHSARAMDFSLEILQAEE